MKAIIEDGCIACGVCESVCPNVFQMNDLAEVKPNADVDGNITDAKDAAEQCPVGIIKIVE
jgi:ferredoxin